MKNLREKSGTEAGRIVEPEEMDNCQDESRKIADESWGCRKK